jgi:putative thioredoxin
VLLVLWSGRAPATAQLNGALEALAAESDGAYVLAEIDIDANMRIAQALQVQAVPTVFAVIGGQLVPGFEGVLPEPQLREFIAAVLRAAQEAGLSGAAPPEAEAEAEPAAPEDPRFDAAEAALADGDFELAAQRFQAILDAEPANAEAALALRQVALLSRIESSDADAIARAAQDPDDVTAHLAAADIEFAGDEIEQALRRLLDLLTRTTGDERDLARTRLLDYFELLGPADERVGPARREMARALF